MKQNKMMTMAQLRKKCLRIMNEIKRKEISLPDEFKATDEFTTSYQDLLLAVHAVVILKLEDASKHLAVVRHPALKTLAAEVRRLIKNVTREKDAYAAQKMRAVGHV